MSEHLLDPIAGKIAALQPSRRRHSANQDRLFLRELNPEDVVDKLDYDGHDPISFGSVRETCPKCKNTHLQLVLRQHSVRVTHLFCVNCESCFDACYANGAPALVI